MKSCGKLRFTFHSKQARGEYVCRTCIWFVENNKRMLYSEEVYTGGVDHRIMSSFGKTKRINVW